MQQLRQFKKKTYPRSVHMISTSMTIRMLFITPIKMIQFMSFSLFDWQLHEILCWLQIPRREQHPRSQLVRESWAELHFYDTAHISCNYRPSLLKKIVVIIIIIHIIILLIIIIAPVRTGQANTAPPPTMPSDECRIWKLQMHKWALKNNLNAEIHTYLHTPESAGLFSQLLNNVWRGLLPQGNEKPYFSLYGGGLII